MSPINNRLMKCCLVFAVFLFPCISNASSSQLQYWNYFKAVSSFEGTWSIEMGEATIEIKDNKIDIKLYQRSIPLGASNKIEWLAETLQGSVDKDGAIHVIETLIGTDTKPEKLEGKLLKSVSKQQWGNKEVNVLYEKLMLSNENSIIGITRRIAQQ